MRLVRSALLAAALAALPSAGAAPVLYGSPCPGSPDCMYLEHIDLENLVPPPIDWRWVLIVRPRPDSWRLAHSFTLEMPTRGDGRELSLQPGQRLAVNVREPAPRAKLFTCTPLGTADLHGVSYLCAP